MTKIIDPEKYKEITVDRIDEYLGEFKGETGYVVNSESDILTDGIIQIEQFLQIARMYKQFKPIEEINFKVKAISRDIDGGKYSLVSYKEDFSGEYEETVNEHGVKSLPKRYIAMEIEFEQAELIERNLKLNAAPASIRFFVVDEDLVNKLDSVSFIDWRNIIIPPDIITKGEPKKYDAFEALCHEILVEWKVKNIQTFAKGTDDGRDGVFLVEADSWIPTVTDCVNKWVLQCKYSDSLEKNIQPSEIYDEIIKVIKHKPDYYLLMTNRNVTGNFQSWFDDVFNREDSYIPLKGVLIGKKGMEDILNRDEMRRIRKKYFGF